MVPGNNRVLLKVSVARNADGTPITVTYAASLTTNRSFANFLIRVRINSLKAFHDCSANAETLSHQCQKSVPLTLRLAQ